MLRSPLLTITLVMYSVNWVICKSPRNVTNKHWPYARKLLDVTILTWRIHTIIWVL